MTKFEIKMNMSAGKGDNSPKWNIEYLYYLPWFLKIYLDSYYNNNNNDDNNNNNNYDDDDDDTVNPIVSEWSKLTQK